MTSRAFILAAMVDFRPGETIVEAGSGESTEFLASLGPEVWTVDIDRARWLAAGRLGHHVWALLGDQRGAFLRHDRPVAFAYMDGWDWPYSNMEGCGYPQEAAYHAMGMEWTQEASAKAHLATMEALHPFIVPGGVVVFDDSWRVPVGHKLLSPWNGKGRLAVPWLLSRGYAIISAAGPIHETHEGFVALRRVT